MFALQVTWFALWGLLWAVYFMLDGFDLGIGILYPFLGRSKTERRLMLNSLGPFWDGNEVWLITAGAMTFAAFPTLYAYMFSYLYTPLLLIFFGLIFRGAAIEFIGSQKRKGWQRSWGGALFLGSLLPALLFGVAFANIFRGLPFDAGGYHGSLLGLLNPYGLLGGLLFLALFLLHGALWINLRTEGPLQERAGKFALWFWWIVLALAAAFPIYSAFVTELYENYLRQPVLWFVPLLAVTALLAVYPLLKKGRTLLAFLASALTILATVFWGIIGLYPNMIPSSLDPRSSLTIFNSSASYYTLKVMFIVVLIFIPLVIVYQFWAYRKFSYKLKVEELHY